MKNRKKEGFSLVELIIAMAITAIVMLALVAIMGYCTRSMRMTSARVALQDQAKDAVNHISAYVLEGNTDIAIDNTNKVLLVKKKNYSNSDAEIKVDSVDAYIYWVTDGSMFFAKATDMDSSYDPMDETSTFDLSTLSNDRTHLLIDDVEDFQCELKKEVDSAKKKKLHVVLNMKDNVSEFKMEKDIVMRNQ